MAPADTPLIRISTPVCKLAASGNSTNPNTSARMSASCRQLRAVESRNASGVSSRTAAANSLRQIGCEAVANRIGNEADGNKTCAETMRESDPALARHLWQQPKAFDPQGDRDEMRHQHQMTAFGPWRPYHRHYGNHHRKQPNRADRHGDR